MGSERSSIFGDDDLDLANIQPKKIERPSASIPRAAAETAGFKSREPKVVQMTPAAPPVATELPAKVETPASAPAMTARQMRRRRTGRNAQLNLKATPETIAEFIAIADEQGWAFGEALERAVELLKEKYSKPKVSKD